MNQQIVEFLNKNAWRILLSPLNGDLDRVVQLFQRLNKDVKGSELVDCDAMFSLIRRINAFCPRSIIYEEFEAGRLRPKTVTIVWIYGVRLEALLDRLQVTTHVLELTPKPKCKKKDAFKQLLRILLEDSSTRAGVAPPFGVSFDFCAEFLQKPTAMIKLARLRAQETTQHKPIFRVCSNENHSKMLANVCFSKKDLVNAVSRNIKMPAATFHKILFQYRSLMSPEVLSCSQEKVHHLPIKFSTSESSPGDCSYLDTCHKMRGCRYLHYYTLTPTRPPAEQAQKPKTDVSEFTMGQCYTHATRQEMAPQWISCDVRYLKFPLLGKFSAIISDPAWDIHMALPYGTCKDMELLSLPINILQDEGIIILWVTGRSIDVGRKALHKWGYRMANEMIWIKLNQLKRTIVTGRTGHWLNHSKEHLLVGIKGNPQWLNRLVDVDTIVSGTRETLRKPDEVYDMVERLVGKHSRKLEIFGRDHNVRPGWLTIGNQLSGVSLQEPELQSMGSTIVTQ